MITVYKYRVDITFYNVEIPENAEILSVGFQNNDIFLWAKVDTEKLTEKRMFFVYETGQDFNLKKSIKIKFIGTAHDNDGLVFHVFEIRRLED